MKVIGLMSGTSCDGIDVALVDIVDSRLSSSSQQENAVIGNAALRADVLRFRSFPYDSAFQAVLLRASDVHNQTDLASIGRLNFELGQRFAAAVLELWNEEPKVNPNEVELIGSHGHTLCHGANDASTPFTWQIAEAAVIAAQTGCRVVSDFRVADVAVGGNGAPLVPHADLLLQKPSHTFCVLVNIGGISNITVLTPAPMQVQSAFDTGPGNMLIDRAMRQFYDQPYDEDGKVARSGNVCLSLLMEWLEHPFFSEPVPKSAGREEFGLSFWNEGVLSAVEAGLSHCDLVATLSQLTVSSLTQAIQAQLSDAPAQVEVAGGGAHNKFLMEQLQASLPTCTVVQYQSMLSLLLFFFVLEF